MTEPEQIPLFDNKPVWFEKWAGMPEYNHEDLQPFRSLLVHFRDKYDLNEFAKLTGQSIGPNQRSAWFPDAEIETYANKVYRSRKPINPRYPVYIISKGRWERRLTADALTRIDVPFRIVVEPQEFDQYAEYIDPEKILVLPFSNLGQGSIPARNWVWEHSISECAARHWILDDNIQGFYRFERNLKCPVGDGTTFAAVEDFADRYSNIPMAGMNYFMFVTRKAGDIPPFYLNTRIYSCILLSNNTAFRWRGRYNEDTDLSIRFLKAGFCTALFNAFLAYKMPTMTMGGGNTDELYKDDGRFLMAESLREQHPDIVAVTERFGRFQHYVNYSGFRANRLIPNPDYQSSIDPESYKFELFVTPTE